MDIFICAFLGQSVWIFTLSESAAFGTMVGPMIGVSGPAWYALAAAMPTVLFMIPLVRCRMVAPGARTFLHIIHGRFGRTAHLMFCTLALLNNLSLVATIIETGNKVFSSISTEITFDLVWIVAITIAGICVGELVRCMRCRDFCLVGSIDKIYEENVGEIDLYSNTTNRMSFRNSYIWLMATRKFFHSIETGGLTPIFMDQATWQTCCYAAPGEESIGVLVSSMLWMTLPYAFATACSHGFVALIPRGELVNMSGEAVYSQTSATVAKALFGRSGLLVLFMMFAFIISNISVFQLFSISSILTFDIYAIHIRTYKQRQIPFVMQPFRVCFDVNCCLLCGKTRDLIFRPKDNCECVPVTCCNQCQLDQANNQFYISGAGVLDITLFSVAIVGGFLFPPLVVCIERFRKGFHSRDNANMQCQSWHRIYELDNPLAPWAFSFAESFSLRNFDMESYNQPDPEEVKRLYRRSWYFALGGPILYLVLYLLIIPAPFYAVGILDLTFFKIWPKPHGNGEQSLLNFGVVTVALAMYSTGASALTVSSYSAVQHGLSGPMWFMVGTGTPLCFVGILITQFRTRAPGAETFPQLMLARFGKRVHLLFCIFTILNNLSIVAAVVNTGCGFYSVISKNVTFELAWIITVVVSEICATVGSMSNLLPFSSAMFIYLLTMTLVITIKVFFYDEAGLLGSIEKIYNAAQEVDIFHKNDGSDHLTMRNYFSFEMGLCKFVASPTVEIAKRLLGPNGLFTLFSLYAFVVTTATHLQILSITKILTFDIYAVHLRPFRVCYEINCCIFCGKSKEEKTRPKDKCQCCEPSDCLQCQENLKSVTAKSSDLPLSGCASAVFTPIWITQLPNKKGGYNNCALGCNVHNSYLKYVEGLKNVRRSSTLIVLCVIVPMGLILNYFSVSGDSYCMLRRKKIVEYQILSQSMLEGSH
ncbi:unnamed protein product [Hydatigera taeniaeformis]|uniref:Uncharacterized protein n=1 Tax=Hydatigena taeniaeformis TaxID=6205 RepID=A0A3P7FHY0_HYDTA|nr:unnamed protein product [Hydatigera taeniaeformis]